MSNEEIEFIEERILELSETRSQLDLSISLLVAIIASHAMEGRIEVGGIINKELSGHDLVGTLVKIVNRTHFHGLEMGKTYLIDSYRESGDVYLIKGWVTIKEDFKIIEDHE